MRDELELGSSGVKLEALQAEVDLLALEKQDLLGKIEEQALEIERLDDLAEVSFITPPLGQGKGELRKISFGEWILEYVTVLWQMQYTDVCMCFYFCAVSAQCKVLILSLIGGLVMFMVA